MDFRGIESVSYYSVTNVFQFVWVKCIMKYVIEERKSGMPYFLYLSLLLSTTILNNKTVP